MLHVRKGRKSLPLLSVGILRAVSPYYYSTTLLLFGDTASSSSSVVYSPKHASSSSYFPFCLRQNLTSCLSRTRNLKSFHFRCSILFRKGKKVSPLRHKFEFLCLARLFPTSSERGRLQLGLEVPSGRTSFIYNRERGRGKNITGAQEIGSGNRFKNT